MAGGLGKSADIIRGLEGARDVFEQALESGAQGGGGNFDFQQLVRAAKEQTKAKLRKLLPKNNVDKLMGGLAKSFQQVQEVVSGSHPEWTEQMCHGHMAKKGCNSASMCTWVYADDTCHDERDSICRELQGADDCAGGSECYFSEATMECRYENARAFSCSRLDGEARKCQAHAGCNFDVSGDKCMYDCGSMGADACQAPDMMDQCEWQVDESAQHGDAPGESGLCVPSQSQAG